MIGVFSISKMVITNQPSLNGTKLCLSIQAIAMREIILWSCREPWLRWANRLKISQAWPVPKQRRRKRNHLLRHHQQCSLYQRNGLAKYQQKEEQGIISPHTRKMTSRCHQPRS